MCVCVRERERERYLLGIGNIMKCNKYVKNCNNVVKKYEDEWSESRTKNIERHTPNTRNTHEGTPQEDDKHRYQLERILTI
jgi:hypothetical protein